MTAWNVATNSYAKLKGWDEDTKLDKQADVTTIIMAGAAVGALFGGTIAGLGRWNCLMITNIVVLAGGILSLFSNFPVFCVGKFLAGLSAGLFSLFSPKYISEYAPIEISGPMGGLSQFFITLGILLCNVIGFAFPHPEDYSDGKNKFCCDLVQCFIPIAFGVI